ncbi:aminopeptidase N [Sphingopyxis lindanitolerans]|uniref:Aminopeptidase N n=1 Tax=Sphingopyxis lindanitolerans TaxID=2054227 RepID=A0A2S8B3F5_9SPHN|nr:aminopeptidase N [Sphingopyxis lindanitolerans]PQM26799.1 aminopeptidase N [Sphingopyxis lindanitolerans]
MTDASSSPAIPVTIHRGDYRAPEWQIPDIALDFALGIDQTRVRSALSVVRHADTPVPLTLRGDGLTAAAVRVDGESWNDWRMEGPDLIVDLGDRTAATVEVDTVIDPAANTQLMGLYASNAMLCTQCEAEGFRRITFHPDRPDVLSRYKVRMEGDKTLFPILLSNGNCVASGEGEGGRHWALWEDPWPKPSYLFALVAGDLVVNRDHFTTLSGRKVELGIWVRDGDAPRTHHAMQALKNSMAWDERVYGREYDLDLFNIVAVSDFNMGAMENKGLNIFNTRYILADPDTATDMDYDGVEGVVAHEYFHNWSGNRVTCRDWFQLSLKEGFTVFRDQSFSAAMGSPAVKRIEDVRLLRAAQFPEDAGPLAHPIRPDSYQEISNFYTATIYNKGAEIIRMMATMMGAERFRKGTDLYFERHDGEAATCEDFVRAMEEGGGIDLAQFRRWYEQAGTPRLRLALVEEGGDWFLDVAQTVPPTPGQPDKQPAMMPLRIAAFAMDGSGAALPDTLVTLTDATQRIALGAFAARPALSVNRGFSAPVIVDCERAPGELAWLAAHDDDPFARYEALQQLMLDTLVTAVSGEAADNRAVIDAVALTLAGRAADAAFVAEAVLLPSEAFIGDQMVTVDPDAIRAARLALQAAIGAALTGEWRAILSEAPPPATELTPAAKGRRRLRGVALAYLAATDMADVPALAFGIFSTADGMTERQAALATLAHGDSDERVAALDIFYQRYRDNPLVLDKWFQAQAWSMRPDTVDAVKALAGHPDFTLANPNRVRALYGALTGNQAAFHQADGAGYRLIADLVIALDPKNPQTAAKMIPPLGRWRRFDEARAAMMKAELERILAQPGLSRDTTEQASKSLLG